jgi:hypothetical protein
MSLVEKPKRKEYDKKFLNNTFENSPFYLISTHGAYNLDRSDWYFKVPEKTFIFETQVITDYCLTTVDEPLFDLLQGVNRGALNYYLLNNKASTTNYTGLIKVASGSYIQTPNTYRNAIGQLIMYGPGDIIPIREISIGRVGSNSRRIYEGMTLNCFEPGQSAVKFPGTKETLILHERAQFHEELIADRESTNKEVIEKVKEMPRELLRDKDQFRVFFFSSCASIPYKPTTQKEKERIMEIESIQHNQILRMLESGIYSVRGGPGSLSVDQLTESKNTFPRAAKTTERFTSEAVYKGDEMRAADPRLVLNNLALVNTAERGAYSTGRTDVKYLYKYKPATGRTPTSYTPIVSAKGTPELRRTNIKELEKLPSRNKKKILEFLPGEKKFVPFFKGGATRKNKKLKRKTRRIQHPKNRA